MSPITALFLKEFRQHWLLAGAAVAICLLIQSAYCWLTWQSRHQIYEFGAIFFTAIAVAVVYAGVAAAIAYSTEHANKTFIFLRKLPISHTMLAAGKIGWALCGTGFVLLANLLLCAFWYLFLWDVIDVRTSDFYNHSEYAWKACAWFFLIITKVFFWGLLWSTLCRVQMNAVAATGASAIGVPLTFTYLCYVLEREFSIIILTDEPSARAYTLIEIALVASLALWRVFRWFDFEAKESRAAKMLTHKVVLFRYPKQVQSPFAALVHHHLRHASVSYHFGILSFAIFSLGILFLMGYLSDNQIRNQYMDTWWWMSGAISSIFGIFVIWGTIFGHDLKNDSYLFLSRMGVPEGAFWWSRILPALILYVVVLVSVTIACLVDMGVHRNNLDNMGGQFWTLFWTELVPPALVVWLALPAMGAFMSISFRSQIVSFVATGGCLYVLMLWSMFFYITFGFSPLWTTLPICLALFVASRLRARYWFKETFTWRSRFIPLAPVFATVLAILIAVPFVRVYEVPNVSWSQIETYFEQADFAQIDGGNMIRAPEKRQALLRHIAAHGTVPAEYEHTLELMDKGATDWELNAFSGITAEEYLLLSYAHFNKQLDQFFSGNFRSERDDRYPVMNDPFTRAISLMFWEKAREERIARLQIVAALVQSGGIQDERAGRFSAFYENRRWNDSLLHRGIGLITSGSERTPIMELHARIMSVRQLWHTFAAIDQWYTEHKTLPESLDVLVEHGFLSAMPEHPFTGRLLEYHRDAPRPANYVSDNVSVYVIGVGRIPPGTRGDPHEATRAAAIQTFRESGGTYLRLGGLVWVIVEKETEDGRPQTAEEEKEEETEPQS
ncbi:MAG: ABC transporter permease [Planctomycetaceae bacterium]|nr:ABC transporter permease [Planctomycetaceae bacterium]